MNLNFEKERYGATPKLTGFTGYAYTWEGRINSDLSSASLVSNNIRFGAFRLGGEAAYHIRPARNLCSADFVLSNNKAARWYQPSVFGGRGGPAVSMERLLTSRRNWLYLRRERLHLSARSKHSGSYAASAKDRNVTNACVGTG